MACRAALILSGGNAKRFQSANQPWMDKALAEIDGKPLLLHIVENLKSSVDKVVVCVNDEERLATYTQLLQKHAINDVKFVVDRKDSTVKGPLLAIATGLAAVDTDYCLVVPTDMPFLKPEVADYLLGACVGYDVAVPMWPDGTVETLLMTLERKNCIEIAETLLSLNRANADAVIRAAGTVHFVSPLKEICGLDPELQSFVNINSHEDLASLKTRSTEGSVIGEALLKRVDFSQCFMFITGRVPGDMIYKAAKVGLPIVASVAAVLNSGVASAEKANITLVGFVRGKRMNVYTCPERILL